MIPESAFLCRPATALPSPRARRSGRQTPTRSATRLTSFPTARPSVWNTKAAPRAFIPTKTAPCPSPFRTARTAMKSSAPPGLRIGDIAGRLADSGLRRFPRAPDRGNAFPPRPLRLSLLNINPSQITPDKARRSAGRPPTRLPARLPAAGREQSAFRFGNRLSFGNNLLRPDLFGNGRTGVNPSDGNRFRQSGRQHQPARRERQLSERRLNFQQRLAGKHSALYL